MERHTTSKCCIKEIPQKKRECLRETIKPSSHSAMRASSSSSQVACTKRKPITIKQTCDESPLKQRPVHQVFNVNQVVQTCEDRNPVPDCEDEKNECCIKVPFKHTFVSARNPVVVIVITPAAVPLAYTFANWTNVDSILASPQLFNAVTGVITVPEDGFYHLGFVLNYTTSAPLTGVDAAGSNVPYIEFFNTTTNQRILAGTFTSVNVGATTNIPSSGQVIMTESGVELVGGHTIIARLLTNGLASAVPVTINPSPTNGTTTLSFYKLRDPALTYNII